MSCHGCRFQFLAGKAKRGIICVQSWPAKLPVRAYCTHSYPPSTQSVTISLNCWKQNVIQLRIWSRISKTLWICWVWRRCAHWWWADAWAFCPQIHRKMCEHWPLPSKCCLSRSEIQRMVLVCGNIFPRRHIEILSTPKTPFISEWRRIY